MFIRKFVGLIIILLLISNFTHVNFATNNTESSIIMNESQGKSQEIDADQLTKSTKTLNKDNNHLESINNDMNNDKSQISHAKWYQIWKKIYYGIKYCVDGVRKIVAYVKMMGDSKELLSKDNQETMLNSLNHSMTKEIKEYTGEYDDDAYRLNLNIRDRIHSAGRYAEVDNVNYDENNDAIVNVGDLVQFKVLNSSKIAYPVYKYFVINRINGNILNIRAYNLTTFDDPDIDGKVNGIHKSVLLTGINKRVLNDENCNWRIITNDIEGNYEHGNLVRAYDADPTGLEKRIEYAPKPPNILLLIGGILALVFAAVFIIVGIVKILWPPAGEVTGASTEPLVNPVTGVGSKILTVILTVLKGIGLLIILPFTVGYYAYHLPGAPEAIVLISAGITLLVTGIGIVVGYTTDNDKYNHEKDSIMDDVDKHNSALFDIGFSLSNEESSFVVNVSSSYDNQSNYNLTS
ncbi:MAG: hypothetical protein LBD03_03405 [Methanobrevibacter sp.]|jgi:hypothetical protein|nr:hypothetical protein [Candidatus Methanovirga procula]